MDRFELLRRTMIVHQLEARGIADPNVLAAMGSVPREAFVPEAVVARAYDDCALPIEAGQTISQPYIVALMAAAMHLRPTDRVLEIGTGSGYAAAVLSRLVREVFTIERHAVLAHLATVRLARLGYTNIHVLLGDGTLGWPGHAPFDAITVAAGAPVVPGALRTQLTVGGRLVIPVGHTLHSQELQRVVRTGEDEYVVDSLGAVAFVPLVGEQGWPSDEDRVTN